MDSSTPSEAVIALGKRIVSEVGVGVDERDTLGRWMAHDIARRITDAETLTGPEGAAARDACAAAILKLWEHRAVFPRNQRPFASVEPALAVLDRLDPKNPANRYFPPPRRPGPTDDWLETAIAVDRAARAILRACTRLAVEKDGGRASAFLKLAEKAELHRDPDMDFVRILRFSDEDEDEDEEGTDQGTRQRADERDALRTFTRAAKKIREALAADEAAAGSGKRSD